MNVAATWQDEGPRHRQLKTGNAAAVGLERQRAQFAWDASRLVLTILAITLPSHLGYGPRIAILSYGVAMTLMYAIHWLLSHCAIKHRVDEADRAALSSAATA